MANICSDITLKHGFWRWVYPISIMFGIFITCIIYGSVSAAKYVQHENTRQLYTNTTCLLLNHSISQHQCQSCGSYSCSYYDCFDESFTVSYSISNGTYIRSVYSSIDRRAQYYQTQVWSIIFKWVERIFRLDWQ